MLASAELNTQSVSLLRFSDEEIAVGSALCASGSVEAVRAWRARLLAPYDKTRNGLASSAVTVPTP